MTGLKYSCTVQDRTAVHLYNTEVRYRCPVLMYSTGVQYRCRVQVYSYHSPMPSVERSCAEPGGPERLASGLMSRGASALCCCACALASTVGALSGRNISLSRRA